MFLNTKQEKSRSSLIPFCLVCYGKPKSSLLAIDGQLNFPHTGMYPNCPSIPSIFPFCTLFNFCPIAGEVSYIFYILLEFFISSP